MHVGACRTCRWWYPDPATVDEKAEDPTVPNCGECLLISRFSEEAEAGIHPRLVLPAMVQMELLSLVRLYTDARFGCTEWRVRRDDDG